MRTTRRSCLCTRAATGDVTLTLVIGVLKFFLCVITVLVALDHSTHAAGFRKHRPTLVQEYLTTPSTESPAAAEQRHQLVAARRKGPLIMAHRGATAFAPENTLEAYAAAMDHGADGCEIDIRRTADGVLVLFHDETLDRITEGFGTLDSITFRELESLRPQTAHGRPQAGLVPTFAALLDLARERIMLLHLDLKVPGIEDEVARLLDAADAWDHVVFVNETNAARLRQHPKLRLLRYKAPGLYEWRHDIDPDAVARALDQPGDMILVDDPRVAAMVLGRKLYSPMPFSKVFRLTARPESQQQLSQSNCFVPMTLVRELQESFAESRPQDLLRLIEFSPGTREGGLAEPIAHNSDELARRTVKRAWAAQQIAIRGLRSDSAIARLERLVRFPSWHTNDCYTALDGAAAARALGKLRATSSARCLIQACQHQLAFGSLAEDSATNIAHAVGQHRLVLAAVQALSDLKCAQAKRFLKHCVDAEPNRPSSPSPMLFKEATLALMRQKVTWDEIAALARHQNPAVRGTAILECIDHPGEERLQGLRNAAPWALALTRKR
ncbi:MAG: glycerophosphodiester phosphodiesterase family protein [Verrucomicrobia bacterium]|nr:glycerophosphodiester phosphodiesterase family protein [Verrucomicrobiota bacterium]